MEFISVLSAVHCENFGPSKNLNGKLQELLESYDIVDDSDVPPWFSSMIKAVKDKRSESAWFEQVGSDIASVLSELADEFGWIVEDGGEQIRLAFPAVLGEVTISREALREDGSGCCSYDVQFRFKTHSRNRFGAA